MSNDQKPKDHTQHSEIFSISFEDEAGGVPGVTQLLNPKIMQEKALAQAIGKTKAHVLPPDRKSMPLPHAAIAQLSLVPEHTQASAVHSASPPARSQTLTSIPTPVAAATPAAMEPIERTITIDLGDDSVVATEPQSHTTSFTATTPVLTAVPTHDENASTLAGLGVHYELQFEMERGMYRYTRMRSHARESLALWQQKFFFQMRIDLKTLEITKSFQEFSKSVHPFHEDAFGLDESSHVQIVKLDENASKLYVLLSEASLNVHEQKVRDLLSGKGVGFAGEDDDGDFKIELAG